MVLRVGEGTRLTGRDWIDGSLEWGMRGICPSRPMRETWFQIFTRTFSDMFSLASVGPLNSEIRCCLDVLFLCILSFLALSVCCAVLCCAERGASECFRFERRAQILADSARAVDTKR